MTRTLVTIPISHFCEKARWALDRAGIEYSEQRHIQIVHIAAAKRAGGGRSTPVLKTPEGSFGDSTAILQYADDHGPPQLRLYPRDEPSRADVMALEDRFDAVLGPESRRWLYYEVFKDARRFSSYNLASVPAWERRIFPFVLAPAKAVIRSRLDISAATAAESLRLVNQELDFVAGLLADGRHYLVGDRFSAADLTFAALSAPLVAPVQYGTQLPQPDVMPASMSKLVRAWREHPAGAFALRMFAQERR
jgi:glutathione S-transferase